MNVSALFFAGIAFVLSASASANPFSVLLENPVRSAIAAPFLVVPPPVPGSELEIADFKELHYWQKNRTLAQCAAAAKETRLILRTFVGSRSDLLSRKEEFKLTKDISILQLKVAAITMDMKNRFNRPRPYLVDATLKPCLPLVNPTTAYPSGHASSAYAIAEALAKLFPARADLFLERAQEISFHRLLGGVHHRTDLIAGERVGRFFGRKTTLNF